MKNVIFIGKSGCGKTTLCQRIHNKNLEYKKTQSIELFDNSIDTPGEYLENRFYYSALIISAADAEVIALVQECGDIETKLPPGFAGTFGREVIGIITKIDIDCSLESIKIIEEQMKAAGVNKIFKVSSLNNMGIESLKNYLYI